MRKNISFYSFSEGRLVFQVVRAESSSSVENPEDETAREYWRERLADLKQKVEEHAKSMKDDNEENDSIPGEFDSMKKEADEITKWAGSVLEESDRNSLQEIEKKLADVDPIERKTTSEKEQQEEAADRAFFDDPVAWFKKTGEDIKQLFKKASSPSEWIKGIAAAGAMLAASWNKIKDYVASAVGPVIASVKDAPVVGGMFTGIEKFIGVQRRALFGALSDAGIELDLAIASHARKGIDLINKQLSAAAKGWNADRLAGEFVNLLKEAELVGEVAKNATKDQIDDIIQKLREKVDASEEPGNVKAKLDDFGLAGWEEGEAKEVGEEGIEFKIKGSDTVDYKIGKDEVKIERDIFNVSAKVGLDDSPDIDVLFEPHVNGTTLATNSKIIYKRTVGDTSESVSITMNEFKEIDDKNETRNDGALDVTFSKQQ